MNHLSGGLTAAASSKLPGISNPVLRPLRTLHTFVGYITDKIFCMAHFIDIQQVSPEKNTFGEHLTPLDKASVDMISDQSYRVVYSDHTTRPLDRFDKVINCGL